MISNDSLALVFSSRPIKMSPRFVLGRVNVPCVAEVVNRSLKADCTDFNKVLAFQLLGVLVFQLFQKVPNAGLVAMTTETMDCRDISWPKQWVFQVST